MKAMVFLGIKDRTDLKVIPRRKLIWKHLDNPDGRGLMKSDSSLDPNFLMFFSSHRSVF
jgi:hypothetical protein